MNRIIYKIIFICTLFSILGCKNEPKRKEIKGNDEFNINDIKLITVKDTLRLDYDGDDFGENIDFGKNESKYKALLFNKIVLDSKTSERFKKLEYTDEKSFEWIKIKGSIKLQPNYNTVILSTLESVYTLLNYNLKGELIDFLDLSKYNQQICQCTSKVYIDKKGIIYCEIKSGESSYPYINYRVNKEGKFEIISQHASLNEEKMSASERLDYIINKTTILKGGINLREFLQSDEFDTSNTTLVKEEDIKKILFSKTKSRVVYKSFCGFVNEYTEEGRSLNILGKILNKDKVLLICNISNADEFCVILVLNKAHEIINFKVYNVDKIQFEQNILEL
jgi:hypothetical protein